jgi:hypothetical protein
MSEEEEAPLEEVARQKISFEGVWGGDMILRSDGFTEFVINPDHHNVGFICIYLHLKGFEPDPDDNMKWLHNTLQQLDAEEASNEQD